MNHNIILSKAFDYQIIGAGFNNILPLKAGEGLKSVFLKMVTNLRYRDIFPLVFIERFYDVNILIGIYILVLPFDIYYVQTMIVILALLWIMLFFMSRQQNIFTLIIDRIKISNKNKGLLHTLLKNISSAIHKKNILQVLIYTIIGWVVQLFLYYLVLVYFSGFDLGLSGLVALLVFTSFGLAIPSLPAGIGVYEAVMTGTLIILGVEKESALAAAIFLHMVQVVPTVTYTIFILIKSKIPLNKISDKWGVGV